LIFIIFCPIKKVWIKQAIRFNWHYTQ